MFKWFSFLLLVTLSTLALSEPLGIGRAATEAEIAGWDIDVRPDGKGLPPGQGSVVMGEQIYQNQCASCHGVFGEGEGRWPSLAGGEGSLQDQKPEKTVGSYWPYASTLWDYIHRAMPYPRPQSLSDDEVYAVTAYVLYLNDLVAEDFVLNQANLSNIKMPNEQGFIEDSRPDAQAPRCFERCADPNALTIVGTINGLTPTAHFKADSGIASSHYAEAESSSNAGAGINDLVGQRVYQRACAACHDTGAGGAPRLSDAAQWDKRAMQGIDVLIDHAVNGFQGSQGIMPAKGGNSALSVEDIGLAVEYMLEVGQ